MTMGTVSEFDEHRGYGSVRTSDGRELFFHCTAIAGGSRAIPVGARVSFSVTPGHLGRWEATDVDQLSGVPAPPSHGAPGSGV
ncbi:MAG: cold-shock protein [Acidimicrobiales bacterium]